MIWLLYGMAVSEYCAKERGISMILTVDTKKSVVRLREDLPKAASAHGFGVLGILDLAAKMKEKGVDFEGEVLIFEVCNPQKAKMVLDAAPEISSFLPCRISVFRDSDGVTKLTTIRPTAMMKGFGVSGLHSVAAEVEEILTAILNDASSP